MNKNYIKGGRPRFSNVFYLIIGIALAASASVMAATTIGTNISTEGNRTVSGSGSIGTGLANHLELIGTTTGESAYYRAAGSDSNIRLKSSGKGQRLYSTGATGF